MISSSPNFFCRKKKMNKFISGLLYDIEKPNQKGRGTWMKYM